MVEKRLKKVEKKVENSDGSLKLTAAEQEILHLLSEEFLSIKQIAIRRQTSDKAVYKVLSKLKKKGAINSAFREVENFRSTIQPSNHSIRLHGQEFNIKILYKDERYKKMAEKSNTVNIDGNTIRLYKNSIEVYSGHSFYADDAQKATAKSFKYWNRLFTRLEHDFKVILIKSRSQNVKLVNQHYAEINNELAEECEKKVYKIRTYGTKDAKLWFTIDNSFNLHEAETQHPQRAKQDMEDVVKPFFNDLRDKQPPLPSEIWKILAEVTKHEKEIGAGLNTVVALLKQKTPQKKLPKSGGKVYPDEKRGYIG